MENIEITPKREKKQLAIAYVATVLAGANYWRVKDRPTKMGTTFTDDGFGRVVASENINADHLISLVILIVTACVAAWIKIRIWWNHY